MAFKTTDNNYLHVKAFAEGVQNLSIWTLMYSVPP